MRRFDRAMPVVKFRGIQGSADGLVGQPAITLDTVGDEHHPGHALFANDRWLAVTDTAEPLPAARAGGGGGGARHHPAGPPVD